MAEPLTVALRRQTGRMPFIVGHLPCVADFLINLSAAIFRLVGHTTTRSCGSPTQTPQTGLRMYPNISVGSSTVETTGGDIPVQVLKRAHNLLSWWGGTGLTGCDHVTGQTTSASGRPCPVIGVRILPLPRTLVNSCMK